jgi:hypothetical protein
MNDEDVCFESGGCSLAGSFTPAESPVAGALLIVGRARPTSTSSGRWAASYGGPATTSAAS